MPWNDQSGGQGGGQGPWGQGPRRPPWGQQQQPPRPPQNQTPDLDDLLRQFRERFRLGGGNGGGAGGGRRGIQWPIIAGALVFGWLLTGFYTVGESERAVVTRFGDYNRTAPPGVHWHIPSPIEARQKVNVTGQRTLDIGYTVNSANQRVDNSDESLMITGDRNLVEVHFRILYNVSNVVDFVYNVREPDLVVRQVGESAMREIIGRRQLEPIVTRERAQVELGVEELMQQVLDEYDSGVTVLQVELLSAAWPGQVIDAFNDVINAGQDAETARNNAERETARIVNEAQAYRERVVREATGEAQRFVSVHSEYRQAPQVTRDRLYLETMERVYRNGNLVILDHRAGAVPYLPLEGMAPRTRPNAPAATQGRTP
jgi:membrane protease subunit HflK